MYVWMYMYVCMYVWMYMYVCMYVWMYMYVCMYVCMWIQPPVCMCVCVPQVSDDKVQKFIELLAQWIVHKKLQHGLRVYTYQCMWCV